jgi:hypothetical protein
VAGLHAGYSTRLRQGSKPPLFFGGLDEKNDIYQALKKAGVPVATCAALHNSGVRPVEEWFNWSPRCVAWLKEQGFIKAPD